MRWCLLALIWVAQMASAAQQVVNFYTWADYVPTSVLKQFQHETGIKVNVSEFSNNDVMYTKIKANPRVGYDVILVSSNYLQRMHEEGMLQRLDLSQIPNLKYLHTKLLNAPFDPHNDYGVPFFWGTTGILVNTKYWDPNTIKSWKDLWQPRFKNKLLLFDDSIETFAIALKALGYSLNDQNPEHIRQAYLKLKELLPNAKIFNTDAMINIYIDEDVTIGMAWNGDAALARQENSHVRFVYPKEGFTVWVDYCAIPKDAPHVENALKFINFLSRPDIAKQIVEKHYYSTSNQGAIPLLPKEYGTDPVTNPTPEIMSRGEIQQYLGKANKLYQYYWQLLKLHAGE